MLFNSIDFLFFFPIVVGIYFVIPRKARYIWLLISSYYFYMSWNPKYALLMGISTVITFASGLLIEKCNQSADPHQELHKKLCVAGSLISNLLILGIFKYANFFLDNLSGLLSALGLGTIDRRLDLLLPVGISFYTFQALSYTLDVYRGSIKAEKNIFRYGLFVSFFPQLVAGPIERSKSLLKQVQNIENINVWNYGCICNGALLMFWGLFQKLVIADRASILVEQVYGNPSAHGFFEISLATLLFAVQIYCDFGGYSNIARGAAQVMGFQLMQNFRQPYFALTVRDFWKRWHISLTSWFTDYLYIPLGGNRKGLLRKYGNIFIVFAISGLWHGASWNFIVWGVLHACYQVAGDLYGKLKDHFLPHRSPDRKLTLSARIRKTLFTFLLVDFAWIFFVVDGFKDALIILRQMCSTFKTSQFFGLGLDQKNWIILAVALLILFLVDLLHEAHISVFQMVGRQELWFRWILYLGLLWGIIMFGIYGVAYDSSQFIYFQF